MLSTIIFLSIFIILISLMLIIDIRAIVDIDNNSIKVVFRLFRIKIITITIDIIGLRYRINKSKKIKSIKFIDLKEQQYIIKQIKKSIFDKLYYDKIELYSEMYVLSPDITASTIGVINIICQNLKSRILDYNHQTIVKYYNTSNFNYKNYIQLDLRVYFTVFDMLFAIIMSLYKRREYGKEKTI